MSIPQADQPIAPKPTHQKPIRLWPGIAAVVLQWLAWFVVPFFVPEAMIYGMLVGVFCGLAVIVWWLFFSRAPWIERVGAIVLMVVAVIATKRIVHPSIAGGMMGMMLPVFSIPVLSLALVGSRRWPAVVSPRASARGNGRRHPARLRRIHVNPHRRHHRRAPIRISMAVDQDSGRTAPGPGRRRAGNSTSSQRRPLH